MNKFLACSRFPITLQCTYSEQETFTELLSHLSHYGFYGIELNLPHLNLIEPHLLQSLLKMYNLKLTYLATGAYAKTHHLSLTAPNIDNRKLAIEGTLKNIDYAAQLGSGIIIGFLKNNPSSYTPHTYSYLYDSLTEITAYASTQNVPVLLEATNHYESTVINSLKDAHDILVALSNRSLEILPDTYHMNIEESHPLIALETYKGLYNNLHISDNNRFFPGYGHLNFMDYYTKLYTLNYSGTLCIEGNVKTTLLKDIDKTSHYLHHIFSLAESAISNWT